MKTALTAAFLATVAAPAAFAGNVAPAPVDPVVPAPVAAVPVVSTQDWTGAYGGVQLGYGDIETESPKTSGEDAIYGLRGGYDYDFGNWVAGGMISYDAGDISLGNQANLDGLMHLGGRVGYDAGPTLIYGTGGYAKAFTSSDAIDPGDSNGYYLGLGLETLVTDNVSVGGEINYNKFDDFDSGSFEAEATTLNIFANYRF